MLIGPPLTPLQDGLLQAAAHRCDHRLTPPDRVKGGARSRLGDKLIALGVAELVVGDGEPIWSRSPSEDATGLRLTAIGLSIAGARSDGGSQLRPMEPEPHPASAPVEPRASTKIAIVLALLQQPEGADLQALTAATGWLPHTTRAALTGLRRKGHTIKTRKREGDGKTVYRIVPASEPTLPSSEAAPSTSEAAAAAPVAVD